MEIYIICEDLLCLVEGRVGKRKFRIALQAITQQKRASSYSHRYCQRSFYLTMAMRHDHIAFPWLSLPADIRLSMLDEISGQKHRGWAQCAAVCTEWQATLEPKKFSQLPSQCLVALEPSYLDDLGNPRYPTKASCPAHLSECRSFLIRLSHV